MTTISPQLLRIAFLGDPNSVHTRRWIEFFRAQGHSVWLLIDAGETVLPGLDPRIAIERYQQYWPRRIPFISSLQGRGGLRAALRRVGPDVLHAHYVTRYAWQARLSGFHPLVISPWGSDVFVTPRKSRRARLWARESLRSADLVTANSRHMARAVIALGARHERVELVQFGVDTTRFAPGPRAPELPAALGLEGRRLVVSLRAIRPLYRHDVIIEALAALDEEAGLVMSARGADAAYLAALQARAAELGLETRMRILPDVSGEPMIELLRAADAVVSVPESDGTPISVLEAMAVGCPVVASDLPPLRELLEDVDPGLLVPVGDAYRLAQALRAVLAGSAAQRRRLGKRLRDVAVERADYLTNMRRMEALYRRLASGNRP